ncbi:DciA family protein [Streptacidiphilus sp. N1-12]|uniref:DciA family protein n=1 Tax=Streptacidiphilus alkalitolerans TaxID=3342712 RepID=A0ABV6WS35_9ACTN
MSDQLDGGRPQQDAVVPRTSGADLAKMALQAAKASARQRGDRVAKQRKPGIRARAHSGDREPVGFAAVLQGLVDQGAWAAPVAGGGVLDRWAAIAPPELAGHVQAVAFDAESGRLQLRPDSASYAAALRLQTPALLRRIAEHAGPGVVRQIRVLAPGRIAAARPVPAQEAGATAAVQVPRSRQDASPGYHQALAACRENRPNTGPAPAIRAAIERQNRAMAREPEEQFTPALDEQLREEAERRAAADVHRRALLKARQERAARQVPSIAPAAAPVLGQTA